MKIAVNFKVNLSQIDQSRCFNGKKGKYADLTCFIDIDEVGEYGDNGTISQQTSKEERDQGLKMPIIGNTTVFWRDDGQPVAKKDQQQQAPQQYQQQAPQQYQQQAPQQAPDNFDQDIPF
jgi:hypothetical protein